MKLVFFLFLTLCSVVGMSQDTLIYLNGKVKVSESVDFNLQKDNYRLFAIGSDTGRVYIYQTDTLEEDDFSIPQMERYVRGVQTARENFKTLNSNIVSTAVGAGSAFVIQSTFYGWLPLMANTVVQGATTPKAHKMQGATDKQLEDEFFLRGYARGARDKKIRQSALFGAAAFLSSIIIISSMPE